MSDVSLSLYTRRSDIKMGKQKVNLSKLVAGKKGSHVPASSYFAFKGKSLIYTAIKQKGARGGYTTAIVKANIVKKLKGAKSESDVREELDNLAGNPRVVQNRHAITNPQVFDVEARLKSTRAFVEIEQDGIDPLEDEEEEDNGEGSSDQPPRPASPKPEEKSPADGGDDLKRKGERRPSTDLHDKDAKRPNETDEEFAGRLKRKGERRASTHLHDKDAKRPNEADENPLPKKDKDETIDVLIGRLEELRGGKEIAPISSLGAVEENESEDEELIAGLGPLPSYLQEALSGTLPQITHTPMPPEENPVDPTNPVEAKQNEITEEQQSDPDKVPEMPEEVQEKNAQEAKESMDLAEKEAARVAGVSEELAEDVVSSQLVDEEEKEMQKKNAAEAAAAIELAQHETNESLVDVDSLTTEEMKDILNGNISAADLQQIESEIKTPLTDAQKADKISGGEATEAPVQTATASADAHMSEAVDPSVAGGLETEEQKAERNKKGAADVEMEDQVQNGDNETDGDALMSFDQSGETALMDRGGQHTISSSANESEAVLRDREIRLKQDEVMASAERAIAREVAAKKKQDLRDATRTALEDERQLKLIRDGYKKEDSIDDEGMLVHGVRDATTPSEALIREILDVITDLPGLRKTKTIRDRYGNDITVSVSDREHEANLQKEALRLAYSSKLAFAKSINVQRMAPPSDEEKAQRAALDITRKRANEGLEGEFPIFSPSNSISEVSKIQTKVSKQIGEMTITEAREKRSEMEPWWQEFTTVRTNQAMHEMERMPSRIIESSVGDVQLASKVQEDTSQDEKNFYNFMYWMMREKMEKMEGGVYWNDFFVFAGAMGYNDMSEARINWLITGNPDGDTSHVDYEGMEYSLDFDGEQAGTTPRITDLRLIKPGDVDVVSRTIAFTPVPHTPIPGKNMSPSAQAGGIQRDYKIVDGKIVALADRTKSIEDVGNNTLSGIPSKISNIADPRFSERGGVQVPNVRIVTRRNPDYKPGEKDSEEFIHSGDAQAGPNDKFENVEVADVGAGSREIGAAIDKAEGDRLTASLPFKLYAPIHPQACDRYLGEKNYARLSLEPVKYFKSYTQQPFAFSDIQQQFNWNNFVMTVYGPMLYAFVTDQAMQLTTPVFDMGTPEGVTLEFMELNELIAELERYQSKSADRSSRVGDSAVAQDPIEKHLSDFFHSRDDEEQDKMADANVAIIALPDQGSGDKPADNPDAPARPGQNPDKSVRGRDQPGASSGAHEGGGLWRPSKRVRFGVRDSDEEATSTQGFGSNKVSLGAGDIDQGVRRSTLKTYNKPVRVHENEKLEKRSAIFRRFNR